MNLTKNSAKIVPMLLTFFVMGYVDLVGIATNYIKIDFSLNDTEANLLASMVFFWFLVLSVPTGVLMNRIGRKRVTKLSLVVTIMALIVPFISYSFGAMFISFVLLGIGNTLMQVSLTPLISGFVSGNRLASTLTLGQFIKAIASFSVPMVATYAYVVFGQWTMVYLVLLIFAVAISLYLALTKIPESRVQSGETSGFKECFSLLSSRVIFMLFVAIVVHVGFDVGLNVTAPKLMMQRFEMPISEAGFATSLYFMSRTLGCLAGAFLLSRVNQNIFFMSSIVMLALGVTALIFSNDITLIYGAIVVMGLGNANIFSILLSQSLLHMPTKSNEISALMVMGLIGGALFPLLMGVASDAINSQLGAIFVLAFCVAYLGMVAPTIKSNRE